MNTAQETIPETSYMRGVNTYNFPAKNNVSNFTLVRILSVEAKSRLVKYKLKLSIVSYWDNERNFSF